MKNIIYVQIYKGDKQYVAEGLNVPVVSQGKNLDEAVANIKEAIDLHFENEDFADYDLMPHPQVLVNFELPADKVYA